MDPALKEAAMDPALKKAAKKGDVNFLKEAVLANKPREYFLSRSSMGADTKRGGNILHLAARHNQVEFFKEAAEVLSADIKKQLLSQTDDDEYGWTPLHATAVSNASHSIVKIIKQMYASFVDDDDNIVEEALLKPWLELTDKNMTPLHLSLENENANENANKEECAMELLSMDSEFESCTIIDKTENTPLCYALKNRFNNVAEMILMSTLSAASIFSSRVYITPLSYAANCSENVVRLLFKRYEDWLTKSDDRRKYTVLHRWADKAEVGPCKLLLKEADVGNAKTIIFKDCILLKEKEMLDTPLHIAGRKKDSELWKILVDGYREQVNASEGEITEIQESAASECPPWRTKNINGNTPLHSALHVASKNEDFVIHVLSFDPNSCKISNRKGESLIFLAVMCGCARVVKEILRIEEPRFHMLRRNDGATVLHNLSACPEETCRILIEKYSWIINLRDDKKKTALDYAKLANVSWLEDLLTDPSLQKQTFNWIEACDKKENHAVLAFVETCQDLERVCREENDTPLHHIKLPTYQDYLNFLEIPSIAVVKNMTNHDGATALHRALEGKDMLLVKALLFDDGVERTIANNNGETAMDLLAQLCLDNEDWRKMCDIIKVNPYLKTSYIHSATNLEQMRSPLSIVAALLATITFAAGFSLPGGFDNAKKQADLARKASFIVFLLADVYALCTSMLVLFCLIWSMVSAPDVARLLVDRSVRVLVTSLIATLIAFMCGIYVVIDHSLLWAAIVTIVMCSITGILAIRTILLFVANMLMPSANRKKKVPKVVSVVQPQERVHQERKMLEV